MKEKIKEAAERIKDDLKSAGWIIAAAVLYAFVMNVLLGGTCPVKLLTGIPCPGCGMTRALFYLFAGNWALSFQMHPLAAVWVAFGLYLAVMRYWYKKKPKGMLLILILLCAVMFGVYLYRMLTIFPNQEPMTYGNANGILRSIITQILSGFD